jgi:hypothetical protein
MILLDKVMRRPCHAEATEWEVIAMRKARFSIAALMGAVLLAALALAVFRYGSEVSAGVLFLLTCGVLCLGVVGIVCRGGAGRAWWLGFTLFGWGYMALAFWLSDRLNELPTETMLVALAARLRIPTHGNAAGSGAASLDSSYLQAGQCIWTLLAAFMGGILAWALFGGATSDAERSVKVESGHRQERPVWWCRPSFIGLAASLLLVLVALAGSRLPPVLWAGATFLLTCALFGLCILGALSGRARSRQVWLGAALFGAGYMFLTLGRSQYQPSWSTIPTDYFLNALRLGPPPIVEGFSISSLRDESTEQILRELERPVPMRFPTPTPLEDVLKYIKEATQGADGKGIRIYVDPIGLTEVDKTLTSPVSIAVEGVPLKYSLYNCLNQLGLTYTVKAGFVMITSEWAVMPVHDDPFLIVGHCLLALVAAWLGGVLGPMASGSTRTQE